MTNLETAMQISALEAVATVGPQEGDPYDELEVRKHYMAKGWKPAGGVRGQDKGRAQFHDPEGFNTHTVFHEKGKVQRVEQTANPRSMHDENVINDKHVMAKHLKPPVTYDEMGDEQPSKAISKPPAVKKKAPGVR